MPVEHKSNQLTVIQLANDPLFTEEINAVRQKALTTHVVLDFTNVRYVTSANLSLLITLRREVTARERQLLLCGVTQTVWALFTVTGLHQLFEVSADMNSAITMLA